MTDKDKNLKSFLENNTKSELKKPINEFSEILGKIEDKPASIFKLPRWFYATAGVITISLFAAYFSSTSNFSTNDEQLMTFLSSSLDDSSLYSDDYDDDVSLLSLVN